MREFAAIVLAAGKGERLRVAAHTDLPKVLIPVLGRPMIAYLLDAVRGAGVDDITLVVGYQADKVRAALGEAYRYVLQERQLGSGHAVLYAKEALAGTSEHILVLCGDSPLFTSETIRLLAEHHRQTGAAITLVSAVPDNPSGYGRILRAAGRIRGIVEEKGAGDEVRAIREVNGGAYAFNAEWLWANIERMRVNPAGELNLTDLVEIAVSDGERVQAISCDPFEILGVNTPEQLAEVETLLATRTDAAHQCGL